jgi:SAM-dependent methyltransferase
LPETHTAAVPHSAYTGTWFEELAEQAEGSAAVVVPLLCSLFEPGSVIDVGCGTGGWLAEFGRQGVAEIDGIDGPWVDPLQLSIDPSRFEAVDLSKPPRATRRFDLVTSFEVAEHLPEQAAAPFVEFLTELGDVVAFSAAIPAQGGNDHLNEQWPAYWSALFAARGYLAFDVVRPKIWTNSEVEFWYRQNLIVYMSEERAAGFPNGPTETVLPLVHPELFAHRRPSAARRVLGRVRSALRLRTRLNRLRDRLAPRA